MFSSSQSCLENNFLEIFASGGQYPNGSVLSSDVPDTAAILDKINVDGGPTSGIFGNKVNLNNVLGGVKRQHQAYLFKEIH